MYVSTSDHLECNSEVLCRTNGTPQSGGPALISDTCAAASQSMRRRDQVSLTYSRRASAEKRMLQWQRGVVPMVDGVRTTFSSWANCTSKAYCKSVVLPPCTLRSGLNNTSSLQMACHDSYRPRFLYRLLPPLVPLPLCLPRCRMLLRLPRVLQRLLPLPTPPRVRRMSRRVGIPAFPTSTSTVSCTVSTANPTLVHAIFPEHPATRAVRRAEQAVQPGCAAGDAKLGHGADSQG